MPFHRKLNAHLAVRTAFLCISAWLVLLSNDQKHLSTEVWYSATWCHAQEQLLTHKELPQASGYSLEDVGLDLGLEAVSLDSVHSCVQHHKWIDAYAFRLYRHVSTVLPGMFKAPSDDSHDACFRDYCGHLNHAQYKAVDDATVEAGVQHRWVWPPSKISIKNQYRLARAPPPGWSEINHLMIDKGHRVRLTID